MFDIVLGSMAIAGFAVVWRNWLEDHAGLKAWILHAFRYGKLHKVVTCGSCFTYWLALAYTIAFAPLAPWTPAAGYGAAPLMNMFIHWMTLAWLSVTLRFLYVALQELVSYQVHKLKGHQH